MIEQVDAVVLGGGIAGSAAAQQLAVRGWHTVLLDRQAFPRHKACGEFLSPEFQEMIGILGLAHLKDQLKPKRIKGARLIFHEGNALNVEMPGEAWGISRYVLDEALHLEGMKAGVDVRNEVTVQKVRPLEEGYEIEYKEGQDKKLLHARIAIAAWGSQPRSGILPDSTDKHTISSQRYIGLKAHYAGIQTDELVTELYFVPGGYIGLSPVEGDTVNVAGLISLDAVKGKGTAITEMIQTLARENAALDQRLGPGTAIPGTETSIAPVHLSDQPLAWRVIPHIGDAALMIPPLCGDGMSIALRSALLCSMVTDRYLQGEMDKVQFEIDYTRAVEEEFRGLLLRGRFIHKLCSVPQFTRYVPGLISRSPQLAAKLVQATRLKPLNQAR